METELSESVSTMLAAYRTFFDQGFEENRAQLATAIDDFSAAQAAKKDAADYSPAEDAAFDAVTHHFLEIQVLYERRKHMLPVGVLRPIDDEHRSGGFSADEIGPDLLRRVDAMAAHFRADLEAATADVS